MTRSRTLAAALLFLALGACDRVDSVEITFSEFLHLKSTHHVEEVWIEGHVLTARLAGAYIREGRPFTFVRTDVPPAYLNDKEGFEKISDGLAPDKLHYSR